ncbi:hypothetical protein T310_4064 [Rasamsonia emersonii CBS 393.64]|uniref:HTH CENPB-type domain-containing protein n=1 Tax=Rasamsonia emersonii (strain ATCC 16479 / CBS 393.64 / IMI 116815) TaxID=1408163 RepID=A0A0F4YUX2_RASE3|nr:hypothetical protein T310_4064 [Rasamsonia emersonii CBS 393.64]KKA21900.1 hypothetical protein T310_4064 [Rasamsonia emersonii CBS 393.64]
MPPRPAAIQDMANILLSERSPADTHLHVGKNWVSTFINCHKELKTQYWRQYNYYRAKFTGAETSGHPPLLQPGNKEWVTVIESPVMASKSLHPTYECSDKGNWISAISTRSGPSTAQYTAKTPTLPGSRASTIPTNWVPETPHNIIELQHQAATIKTLLKRHQLIKGCELAINSAVILVKENHDLRAANEKQKQKRKRSTNQISHEGGFTVQEAQDLIQSQILDQNQMAEGVAAPAAEAPSAPQFVGAGNFYKIDGKVGDPIKIGTAG